MSLKLKNKKVNRIPPIESGSYVATCVGVVDLGEQYNEKFNSYSNQIQLLFELSGETVEIDGEQKPRQLSKNYRATLNERSNLSKDLVSWRCKPFTEDELSVDGGFDVRVMAGETCMLTVLLTEGKNGAYNKITGIAPLPKGMPVPKPESEILIFDMDDPDETVLEKLPQWLQEKVHKSTEYSQNPPDKGMDLPEEEQEEDCPI